MSVKGVLSQLIKHKYIFLNYYPVKGRLRAIGYPGEAEVTLFKKKYSHKTEYTNMPQLLLKPLSDMKVRR